MHEWEHEGFDKPGELKRAFADEEGVIIREREEAEETTPDRLRVLVRLEALKEDKEVILYVYYRYLINSLDT